jgi:hypothetical protein
LAASSADEAASSFFSAKSDMLSESFMQSSDVCRMATLDATNFWIPRLMSPGGPSLAPNASIDAQRLCSDDASAGEDLLGMRVRGPAGPGLAISPASARG